MGFDLEKIFAAKRAFHGNRAEQPIAENLRMLAALREREVTIRRQNELNKVLAS